MKRDLADFLLRSSIGSVRSDRECCSSCHRTPLAGESMHRLSDAKLLCPLCISKVPEKRRQHATTERVHVGSVRVSVMPRAA